MLKLCRSGGILFCCLALLAAGCAAQKKSDPPRVTPQASEANTANPGEPAARPSNPADGQLDSLAPTPQPQESPAAPAASPAPAHKPAASSTGTTRNPAPVAPGQTYVVQAGDTLYKIARQVYGTANKENVDKILNANRGVLSQPSQLKPGMKLTIPK